ncbi:HpcH/HpaI aldolase family protein [Mammaliicoccus sciuri]|uniref:HpcH/HpaI aldolase family protein n=1 Tax=Mammaliicoccus sciuri TaxID=1296 RepID=UPI003F567B7F
METYILKEKLNKEQQVIGGFLSLNHTSIVEMMGYSHFDFVVIDNEHGAFSEPDISELVKVSKYVGLTPIVRTVNKSDKIQKVLDSGAHGIQIPMVNNKEEAEYAVQCTLFPPLGNRGVSYSIPAAKYGLYNGREYLDHANKQLTIAIQIETEEAIRNIDEILTVDHIDVVFIGKTDLSINLGLDVSSKKCQSILDDLIQKVKNSNKKIGVVTSDEQSTKEAIDQGIDYIVVVINSIISNAMKSVTNLKK